MTSRSAFSLRSCALLVVPLQATKATSNTTPLCCTLVIESPSRIRRPQRFFLPFCIWTTWNRGPQGNVQGLDQSRLRRGRARLPCVSADAPEIRADRLGVLGHSEGACDCADGGRKGTDVACYRAAGVAQPTYSAL